MTFDEERLRMDDKLAVARSATIACTRSAASGFSEQLGATTAMRMRLA